MAYLKNIKRRFAKSHGLTQKYLEDSLFAGLNREMARQTRTAQVHCGKKLQINSVMLY